MSEQALLADDGAAPPRRASCSTSVLLLCLLTEATALMYSGIVFGWAPMVLTLKREGLFADSCGDAGGSDASGSSGGGDGGCFAQTTKLTQIYSVGTVVYGASGVIQGALIDRFGPRFGVFAAGTLTIAGLYLFGCFVHEGEPSPIMFAGAGDSEAVPMAGFVCLSLGGMAFFLTSFKMVVLLPPQRQGLAAAGLTTLGDASCAVFLLANILNAAKLPLWKISLGYMIITAVITLALLALWSANMRTFEQLMSGTAKPQPEPEPEPEPGRKRAVSTLSVINDAAKGAGMLAMARSVTSAEQSRVVVDSVLGAAWQAHLKRKYGARLVGTRPSFHPAQPSSDGRVARARSPAGEAAGGPSASALLLGREAAACGADVSGLAAPLDRVPLHPPLLNGVLHAGHPLPRAARRLPRLAAVLRLQHRDAAVVSQPALRDRTAWLLVCAGD